MKFKYSHLSILCFFLALVTLIVLVNINSSFGGEAQKPGICYYTAIHTYKVGLQPNVVTITAATGFNVVATALDTSTYNYAIIKNAA